MTPIITYDPDGDLYWLTDGDRIIGHAQVDEDRWGPPHGVWWRWVGADGDGDIPL